ncbi:hypothetical protein V8J38_16850 (plasmid) [Brevundimonas olei]|uniref:Uncharacterized protein n=1 Tax=Brevundimonas olei TaxID=657642 RepID=A0ABZ2IG27_9CAUL
MHMATDAGNTRPYFKVDVHWPEEQRADKVGRTQTHDPVLAIAAFRRLLARDDLVGRPAAARLMVNGRRLYYSEFWKPIGSGRIHADAPIDLSVDRDGADALGRWTPSANSAALLVQRDGQVAPRAAAADVQGGTEDDDVRDLAAFMNEKGWIVRDRGAQALPLTEVAKAILEFWDAPVLDT